MSFIKTLDGEVRRNVSGQQIRKKLRQASTSATGTTVTDDFKMKNGYLYTVVRAITARVNQNFDGWPSEELRQAYKTFVGKPVFVNHQNEDPTKARGRVVAARYFENGNDKGVECIMEVDAARFPKLAHEIRSGGLDSVSMGAEAGHTICSMCGNRATDTHDMCDHVKFHKGEHLMKDGKRQLVYESCHKLGFFELSYVFDPADETAVVSKVIQANITPAQGLSAAARLAARLRPAPTAHREVEAMIRQAYGETEAPESVDTMRQEEEGSEEDFHSYVETPKELRDPNLDRTQQIDREQEAEGLDADRNVEDIEGFEGQDHAHNERQQMRPEFMAALRQAGPYDSGFGGLDTTPGSDFVDDHLIDVLPPYPGSDLGKGGGGPRGYSSDGIGDFAEGATGFANDMVTPDDQTLQTDVGSDFTKAMEPQTPTTQPTMASRAPRDTQYLAALGVTPVNGGVSQMNERRARKEDPMARRSSLASRGKTAAAGQHHLADTSGLTDGGDHSADGQSTREPGEEEFISQTPGTEPVDLGDAVGGISNTENNLVARMQHTQAQLLRDAARLQELQRRKANGDPNGASASGTATVSDGVQGPALDLGHGDFAPPTAPTVTALGRRQMSAARRARVQNKMAWMVEKLGRKLTVKEAEAVVDSVPEAATVVNPPLSGTDDQSLKGTDFQPADPNAGAQSTQPKDASVRAFQAFDQWLRQSTGKTARQHGHEGYVLRQAKRFADHHGFNPQAYFPTMGNELRQIRSAAMQRQAVDLDVAAPGGRVDVEAPTANTTDAEAQASQFDLHDFGNNAGDGIADPVLNTDGAGTGNAGTWAPGEGSKEGGYKRASAASAVRCADLFVEAGLRPASDRYNLVAMHENMRAGQVAERIAMAEAFVRVRRSDAQRNAAHNKRVASGISRGASTAVPPGFGGGGHIRAASTQRVSAAEDQSTDDLMFM